MKIPRLKKTSITQVRIEPDLLKPLTERAKAEHRPLSNLVNFMLRGLLNAEKPITDVFGRP